MPDPQQERPSPPGKELKIKRPGSLEIAPQPVPVPVEQGLPAQGATFLRKVLWGLLVVWLLVLGFMVLDLLPFLFPDEDSAGSWWRIDTSTSLPSAENDVPEPTVPDHPELASLKQKLAAAIVNSDLNGAMTLIRQQRQSPEVYPYQDDLIELGKTLAALKRVNVTVADILREHIDKEVVIRIRDRAVKIIPRASAGERLNVLVVPADTSKPGKSATFKVTDLAALERSRWVGKADTPLKSLMKLYLHLEADDRDGARAFAPNCGMLAAALEAQFGSTAP